MKSKKQRYFYRVQILVPKNDENVENHTSLKNQLKDTDVFVIIKHCSKIYIRNAYYNFSET